MADAKPRHLGAGLGANVGDAQRVLSFDAGMTIFDLPRSRAERDLEQWQAIIDWAEAGEKKTD